MHRGAQLPAGGGHRPSDVQSARSGVRAPPRGAADCCAPRQRTGASPAGTICTCQGRRCTGPGRQARWERGRPGRLPAGQPTREARGGARVRQHWGIIHWQWGRKHSRAHGCGAQRSALPLRSRPAQPGLTRAAVGGRGARLPDPAAAAAARAGAAAGDAPRGAAGSGAALAGDGAAGNGGAGPTGGRELGCHTGQALFEHRRQLGIRPRQRAAGPDVGRQRAVGEVALVHPARAPVGGLRRRDGCTGDGGAGCLAARWQGAAARSASSDPRHPAASEAA